MRALFTLLTVAIKFFVHALLALCKVLYYIVRALRIRLLVLFLIVSGILQFFFHTFSGEGEIYFWIGTVLCLLLTLCSWWLHFKKEHQKQMIVEEKQRLRREEKERRRREKEERRAAKRAETEEKQEQGVEPVRAPEPEPEQKIGADEPQYFEVTGHLGYVFAEYRDRYVLYKREEGKLLYIKTDFKEQI